jgi:ectoine hydroxylase-related dioxygenase (phytanoyl-CoA dioxygenase family)
LAEEIKDSYQQNGFYIHEAPVPDARLVLAAREGMDHIIAGEYDTGSPPETSYWNPGDDPQKMCKIEQPQKANHAMAELIRSSDIGAIAATATGAEMVQVWWVQLLRKPVTPESEGPRTNVGWHRDWTYHEPAWADNSNVFTAWIALNDLSVNSGPITFVLGSHQWGETEEKGFFDQDIGESSFAIPPGETRQDVPAVLGAGGLSLHHRLTLHASGPNTSHEPRCALALHLRTEKSRPRDRGGQELTKYLDDEVVNPIVFGPRVDTAF